MSDTPKIRQQTRQLAHWIIEYSLGSPLKAGFLEEFCARALSAGLPLYRVNVSWRTLHPTVESVTLIWYRGRGVDGLDTHEHGSHSDQENVDWQSSPLKHLMQTGQAALRRRLVGPDAQLDFPVLRQFRDEGATDYIATLKPFAVRRRADDVPDGVIMSWCTDADSGFSDDQRDEIQHLSVYLAMAVKLAVREQTTRNVLRAYLGGMAARKVLGGHIQLGDGELISAVVWYCDLRDSTLMADELTGEQYLRTLNDYFSCTAGAVMNAGGEVLRFIGDGVLAIFPLEPGGCQTALDAAIEVERRFTRLNRSRSLSRLRPLSYGLGLHLGKVMFGNVGVPDRLDFSVTGPTANEAARIEGITKRVGYRVIASANFAHQTEGEWVPLGSYPLRGVGEAMPLFALARSKEQGHWQS